jgi:hypothetical protein
VKGLSNNCGLAECLPWEASRMVSLRKQAAMLHRKKPMIPVHSPYDSELAQTGKM